MFDKIDDLQKQLKQQGFGFEHILQSLQGSLLLEWIYCSNALEGCTLSKDETKALLEGLTLEGKSLEESAIVVGHKLALDELATHLEQGRDISEEWILSLQGHLLGGNPQCSQYRTANSVMPPHTSYAPPNAEFVAGLMSALLSWYLFFDGHPVERAVRLHNGIVKIQPFSAANGQLARLLMNFDLMQSGYLPVVISIEQKLNYSQALEASLSQQNHRILLDMVISSEEQSLNAALHAIQAE